MESTNTLLFKADLWHSAKRVPRELRGRYTMLGTISNHK